MSLSAPDVSRSGQGVSPLQAAGDPAAVMDDALLGARIVVVHDYLTQRGGAERVVLRLLEMFPGCRILTSVYNSQTTFSAFKAHSIETLPMRARPVLARNHRLGLLLFGSAFRKVRISNADVVLCSSSGFSHLVQTDAPKVVYCYNPPRWLYQESEYRKRLGPSEWLVLRLFGRRLRRRDVVGARSAAHYVAISRAVAGRIREVYGIEAEVLHPPYGISPGGPTTQVIGVPEKFMLLQARGRRYKNVATACEAADRAKKTIVVVGSDSAITGSAHVVPLRHVSEPELRWLYERSDGVLALAHEDFGLTPVEGHAFGKPTLALRRGGYLDSVIEGLNGSFIEDLSIDSVAKALEEFDPNAFDTQSIIDSSQRFSPETFANNIIRMVSGLVKAEHLS